MQLTAPPPKTSRRQQLTGKAEFTVVGIHDGYLAKERAQKALDRLQAALLETCRLRVFLWSFDKLTVAGLRAMSIHLTAAADMIIVSAADAKPLPEHIQQWLRSSLAEQRDTHPMLVALHDEKVKFDSPQGALCTHLKQVADSWQAEFMCNEDFDKRLHRDSATQLIRPKSPGSFQRAESFGREFFSAPVSWGINDG